MVLWICLGLIVLGLFLLAIVGYEVSTHLKRFQRAVAEAQGETMPRVVLIEQFVQTTRAELSAGRDTSS